MRIMRTTGMKAVVVAGCLLACMVCPTAFAQGDHPKYEVFGGISFLKTKLDFQDLGWGNMRGFEASFAANLSSSFGIKTDVNIDFARLAEGEAFEDTSLKRVTMLVGPQLTRRSKSIDFFVHSLAGFARIDDDYGSWNYSGYAYHPVEKANGVGMAFGGGLDWKITDGIGWRIAQVDYLPIRAGGRFHQNVRIDTGILIPIGGR